MAPAAASVATEAETQSPPPEVLAVGPAVSSRAAQVSGQAMMFQLLVDILRERGWRIRVFDIAEAAGRTTPRMDGAVSASRVRDYLRLLPRVWKALFSRRKVVYLTTAQSLVGFVRDAAVIWPARLLGHRVVGQQFGGNYAGFYARQSGLVRVLIRATLNRLATVVVEGNFVKEQFSFLPDYATRVCTVANGLPERSLQVQDEPRTWTADEPFLLFYLSNMLEDVLEATGILVNERNRNVYCRFAGKFLTAADSKRFPDPAEAKASFLQYVEEHHLQDRVSYSESLFGDEKARAFRESHVFLLPSNYINEGQPVSVLEAMAYGVVVIGTDHRLIPMMVADNETGFLVPYGNPAAIADKVESLMDDPEVFRTMSEAGIQRFRDFFSPNKYVSNMAEVLRRAGGKQPA
jgi:glycosyltransferase involved in cell wall biosynthesis